MDTSAAEPSFLANGGPPLLLFGGKGGVGKTTCATATALHLARNKPEETFFLVSTDPAHSLLDSLSGSQPPDNLTILEFDAKKHLETFKEKHSPKFREIASRGTFLDDGDISAIVDLSLPGLDELMAFLEIARVVEQGCYNCIIVDTAPTGHALCLLAMPGLIEKWLSALNAMLAKHRYLKQSFSGSTARDEIDKFLQDLADSVQHLEALLKDPLRCNFVPVLIPEALSISENFMLLAELKRIGITVSDMVVNRLHPSSHCSTCTFDRNHQIGELQKYRPAFGRYRIWGVPLFPKEVRGMGPLKAFWENASILDLSVPEKEETGQKPFPVPPRVEGGAELPSRETKLLLFAGKGGVGKTTLACATALHLAQVSPERKIFLFSTDPANSLSCCLDTPIGPSPVSLTPGLTALEIDAQAEFSSLKKQYAKEVENFLTAVSPHLDLTFDREVLERLMDLSPSGLDEVMALTRAMDLLTQRKYDLLIIDSAPTGHLIRLLELPELINAWLKVFFDLFLKYRHIFRFPAISTRLVDISKGIKFFQHLLRDPARSALYPVANLTEMVFEETRDLLTACKAMGISTPTMFLNLATPASSCPQCRAIALREWDVRTLFQQALPHITQTLIYRQDEPRGLQRLRELGQALYVPAATA